MQRGDLTATPLAPLLLQLADEAATGCLGIAGADEAEAFVYLKAGLIYSVAVPGDRPQLGAKLVSSGALAPDALAEALEAQRSELQGWRLGELLVHLGYVDQPVVEAFVREQVCEAMWDLLRWPVGEWKFRKNVKAREDVAPPMTVIELLETLRARGYEWESISAIVHGPAALPKLSTHGEPSGQTVLDNDAWSMLCKIDGERSVAELAHDCGYTLFEAGQIIVSLVESGLVDIEEDLGVVDDDDEPYGVSTLSAALAGEFDDADATADPSDPEAEAEAEAEAGDDALAKLARLVHEVSGELGSGPNGAGLVDANGSVASQQPAVDPYSMRIELHQQSEETFAASIAQVSTALSDVLGAAPAVDVPPVAHPVRRASSAPDDPEWERRKRQRTAAAAELATAQALIESLRTDEPTPTNGQVPAEVPRLVDDEIETDAVASIDAEEPARHAAEQTARLAAEQFARAAAEEAERVAAEQEAQRVAIEQAAAEDAERMVAEQEAARLAAERAAAEAERLAAEIEAAATDAWAEHERREAADRLRAQIEAAEAEAWTEYEQREHAAREAAAEAEAERLEAERLEAERLAAEAEAERLEAERREAERRAAEAEAERLEAERLAVERAAAEQAEAERLEAERRETDRLEAEAAARREDEAAAATALLVELAASSDSAFDDAPPVDSDPEPEPEPEPDDVDTESTGDDLDDADDRGGWTGSDTADTAALLRELSSLSDDAPPKPSGSATPARPSGPSRPSNEKKPKKKIGLFGL